MRVIGYTSEWHAAGFCLDCVKHEWSPEELAQGHSNTLLSFDAKGMPIYGRGYNLHPVFSTDEHNLSCDRCLVMLPNANGVD